VSDIIELKLKECLKNFLCVIDRNFQHAEQQWKSGELSKGAFEYIYQRHVISHVLLGREDIKGEMFFDIYAPITIDIRSGIELYEEEEKSQKMEELKEWLLCFDQIGFTDRQPVFDYPMKNLNNFDKLNPAKK
jgi:hypothetical protein